MALEVIRKPWNAPAVGEGKPHSHRDPWVSPLTYGYEGKGDPQLPYECFTDFTYPRELRDRMRAQFEVECLLMPDDDWFEHRTNFVLGRKAGGKNKPKTQPEDE